MVREAIDKMETKEYAEDSQAEIDMSLNENPLGASEEVISALRDVSPDQISRYQHPSKSKEKLADFLQLSEDKLILTDGCDGAIEMVAQTFFEKDAIVAIPVPSFPRYVTHTRKMGAEVERICPETGFHPSIERMKNSDADYLILANPQNPSGEKFDLEELRELSNGFEGHLIIDEAMAHFDQDHSNLVSEDVTVIGSFSKIFGMAGLRAGYLVSEHAENLAKTGSQFKINSMAQIGIGAVLNDQEYVQETRQSVEKELRRLKQGLDRLNIGCSDSECLTMLLDFNDTEFEGKASELADQLLDNRVKVVEGRQFEGLDDNFLRISIRNKEVNQKFLDKISELVETEKIKDLEVEN